MAQKTLTEQIFSIQGIVLIVIALMVFNVGGLRDKTFGGDSTPLAPSGNQVGDVCFNDGATMTIGPMQQMWYPIGDVSYQYARVFVNAVDQGLKADGASVELSPGDNVDVYYAENASSGVAFHYTAKQSFVVPCRSDFPSGDSTLDNDAYKVYNSTQEDSGNLSTIGATGDGKIKCFSQDDGLLINGSQQEDITTGDDVTLRCQLEGIYREAFSPYFPAAVCIEYNDTKYDVVEILDSNKNVMSKVSKPSMLTTSAAGLTYVCHEFPSILSNDQITFYVHEEVSEASSLDFEGGNLTMYWVDQDWYRDTTSGLMEHGYEDNDNNDVGTVQTMTYTLVNLFS